ncbi:MAG TPA: TetR/AcrR family transcriptional regulator [Rhizobacter sp.]|nr:TetR/AcrR family transcriptional regulator [Rhizobacter sp.]
MGHSQADKAGSRERILKQAAQQIREQGLESLSVNKLMRSVDLTHGGFYGHFASRSELLAEALECALADSELQARSSGEAAKGRSYSAMVRAYLSRSHRDTPRTGCAIPTLASEASRAGDDVRQVMANHVEDFVATASQALGHEDDEQALVAVSAMVGALALSRVLGDGKRSDALLRAVRQHLLAFDSQPDNPTSE